MVKNLFCSLEGIKIYIDIDFWINLIKILKQSNLRREVWKDYWSKKDQIRPTSQNPSLDLKRTGGRLSNQAKGKLHTHAHYTINYIMSSSSTALGCVFMPPISHTFVSRYISPLSSSSSSHSFSTTRKP